MGATCGKCLPEDLKENSYADHSPRDDCLQIHDSGILASTEKKKLVQVPADRSLSAGSTQASESDADNLKTFISIASDMSDSGGDSLKKFHSALRWGKPWEEIVDAIPHSCLKDLCNEKDAKTGNSALHIATQNGHLKLVKQLVHEGSTMNAQNKKGQTALHMGVGYDMYFTVKFLVDSGADGQIENTDGHKAITGIDGTKIGNDAWDNPVNALKDAKTKEEVEFAYFELENALSASKASIDKGTLVQVGMSKKKDKAMSGIWDHARFMGIAKICK